MKGEREPGPGVGSGTWPRRIDLMAVSRKILGFWVDCVTMEDAIQRCLSIISGDRRPRLISTINAATVVLSRDDERLRRGPASSELGVGGGGPPLWVAPGPGGGAAPRGGGGGPGGRAR